MGRGIKPRFEAALLEDGGKGVGGRTLTIGACYMDAFELGMRIAQSLTK